MIGDRLKDHGAHLSAGGGGGLDGDLVALVKVLVEGCVKGLAVEDGGGAGIEGTFPRCVGGNILGSAVLIFNMKVSPQDAVAVEFDLALAQHLPHEVGAVLAPAGGDLDLQAVLALLNQVFPQVADAIIASLGIIGMSGIQMPAVKWFAVERGVVITQTAIV